MNNKTDFNDIKKLWQTYDNKLECIDAGNKNLLKHLLSQKVSKHIHMINYQSLAGAIIAPLLFLCIVLPIGLSQGATLMSVIGLSLIFLPSIIKFILGIIFIIRTNQIKIDIDPIIITQKKLLGLEQQGILLSKIRNYTYPLLAGGFILIFWNIIPYSTMYKMVIFAFMFFGVYFWGKYKFKLYFKDKINKLKVDIQELSEFKK